MNTAFVITNGDVESDIFFKLQYNDRRKTLNLTQSINELDTIKQ